MKSPASLRSDRVATFPGLGGRLHRNTHGVEIGTVTGLYDGHDALFFTQLFDFLESFVGSLRIESEVSLFLTVVRVEQSGGGFQLTNVPPETGY